MYQDEKPIKVIRSLGNWTVTQEDTATAVLSEHPPLTQPRTPANLILRCLWCLRTPSHQTLTAQIHQLLLCLRHLNISEAFISTDSLFLHSPLHDPAMKHGEDITHTYCTCCVLETSPRFSAVIETFLWAQMNSSAVSTDCFITTSAQLGSSCLSCLPVIVSAHTGAARYQLCFPEQP